MIYTGDKSILLIDGIIYISALSTIQLCSTKFGRVYLRSKQVYLILRELHKWEKEPEVLQTIENLVGILISDEPEPGMENLHDVEMPEIS